MLLKQNRLKIYRYLISLITVFLLIISLYNILKTQNYKDINYIFFFYIILFAIITERYIIKIHIFSYFISITLADIVYMLALIYLPIQYLILTIFFALLPDVFNIKRIKFEVFATNLFNTTIPYIIGYNFLHKFLDTKSLTFNLYSLYILTITLIIIYLINLSLVYIIIFLKTQRIQIKELINNNINVILANLIFISPLTFLTLFYIKNYKYIWILLIFPLIGMFLSFKNYQQLYNQLRESLFILSKILDNRDWYTAQHSWRVSHLAVQLAKAINLHPYKIERIKNAALIHDIGKIAIKDNILNKPGKLTQEEFNIIKKHTIFGEKITKSIFPEDANILKYHHERWDGKGYPEGLKGEEIPLEARIIAVADTYDAMNSTRIYRKNLQLEEIIKRLKDAKGKQLDPYLVDEFIKLIEKKEI